MKRTESERGGGIAPGARNVTGAPQLRDGAFDPPGRESFSAFGKVHREKSDEPHQVACCEGNAVRIIESGSCEVRLSNALDHGLGDYGDEPCTLDRWWIACGVLLAVTGHA